MDGQIQLWSSTNVILYLWLPHIHFESVLNYQHELISQSITDPWPLYLTFDPFAASFHEWSPREYKVPSWETRPRTGGEDTQQGGLWEPWAGLCSGENMKVWPWSPLEGEERVISGGEGGYCSIVVTCIHLNCVSITLKLQNIKWCSIVLFW